MTEKASSHRTSLYRLINRENNATVVHHYKCTYKLLKIHQSTSSLNTVTKRKSEAKRASLSAPPHLTLIVTSVSMIGFGQI